MGSPRDYTAMGGVNAQFPPTEWTRVIEPAIGQAILDELVNRYWRPIYCFLRKKGCDNEEAKDLTQGFFTEIVMDSNLFQGIERTKGKFRTILLTALNHYVIDVARHNKRKKRHPGAVTALEEDLYVPETSLFANPEAAFDYAWASEVLQTALKQLKEECEQEGLSLHWEVFNLRFLQPTLEQTEAPSLPAVCKKLGIENDVKASNMIVTVKRRFKQILKRQVGKYLGNDSEVEQEISRLADLFAQGTA